MTADRLREAARVLRERAEAATPGPWAAMEYDDNPGDEGVCLLGAGGTVTGQHMIGYFHVLSRREQEANADYARTMHPGVGLALADWLELVGAWRDEGLGLMPDGNLSDAWLDIERQAKAVADLILGSAP